MGEYIGEVVWCNNLRMEIETDKTLHNGDGLCFLNRDNEVRGLRADVVLAPSGRDVPWRVSTNRPHGAERGTKIYRNYDIEWQKQVEASTGNRKIDIELVLAETETGYEFCGRTRCVPTEGHCTDTSNVSAIIDCDKIPANNPEKATENIRKKALQWGDTVFNPVNLELQFSQPYLIPASVIGEMKRELVAKLTEKLIENHRNNRPTRCGTDTPRVSSDTSQNERIINSGRIQCVPTDKMAIPESALMTCHHCIRYANGMCPKITGKPVSPLFIRNGENVFGLEFDCKNCLMRVVATELQHFS